jgi:hypothetical protein
VFPNRFETSLDDFHNLLAQVTGWEGRAVACPTMRWLGTLRHINHESLPRKPVFSASEWR